MLVLLGKSLENKGFVDDGVHAGNAWCVMGIG